MASGGGRKTYFDDDFMHIRPMAVDDDLALVFVGQGRIFFDDRRGQLDSVEKLGRSIRVLLGVGGELDGFLEGLHHVRTLVLAVSSQRFECPTCMNEESPHAGEERLIWDV